jgi:hypothetical protein
MAKTTLRLPEYLLEKLRERSREEGRSLNTVTVETLRRGLGLETTSSDVVAILGDMVVQPATQKFDPEALERRLSGVRREARDLTEALDWTREARI